MLRSEMSHFVTNLQYYLMFEVLEGAWQVGWRLVGWFGSGFRLVNRGRWRVGWSGSAGVGKGGRKVVWRARMHALGPRHARCHACRLKSFILFFSLLHILDRGTPPAAMRQLGSRQQHACKAPPRPRMHINGSRDVPCGSTTSPCTSRPPRAAYVPFAGAWRAVLARPGGCTPHHVCVQECTRTLPAHGWGSRRMLRGACACVHLDHLSYEAKLSL